MAENSKIIDLPHTEKAASADGETYDTEIINSLDRLRAVEEEWLALLQRSDSDCVFLTPDWLCSWWETFTGEDDRMCVCTVRNRRGNLIALAPLMISQRRWLLGLTRVPALQFMGTGTACSDYLDFIIERNMDVDSLVKTIFKRLTAEGGWRAALFTDIPDSSPTIAAIEKVAAEQGFSYRREPNTLCPYLELPEDWESCLRRLSKHFRKQVRKSLRGVGKLGKVNFALWTGEIQEGFARFMRLHELRWEMARKKGSFADPRMRNFHLRVMQRFQRRGWLRLWFLEIDDKQVAARLGYTYNGRHYAYQAGFDPRWAEHSVGQVAQAMAIQNEIKNGIAVHDFLRGRTPIKFRWTQTYRTTSRLWLLPRGDVCLRVWLLAARFCSKARHAVKRVVPGRLYGTLKRLAGRE